MVTNIPGETHDHPHHRGLWFTHGDVNGYDFWGNEPGQSPKQGKVVLKSLDGTKSGKNSGSVATTFNWNGADGKTILTEKRAMVFYATPADTRTIDFDIILTPLEKVKFGDTKEGTFAIRLAAGLEEPHPRAPRSPGAPARW